MILQEAISTRKKILLPRCQVRQLEISLKRFMGRPIGKTEAFDSSTQKQFFLSKSILLCCELSFRETTECRKLASDEKELSIMRRSFKKNKIKCFINPF